MKKLLTSLLILSLASCTKDKPKSIVKPNNKYYDLAWYYSDKNITDSSFIYFNKAKEELTTSTEIPSYFKIVGALRLQKLIPVTLLRNKRNLGLRFMGAKSADEKALLIQLIQSSDPSFIKWALTPILTWKNTEQPSNMTHFHGTSDFILPLRFTKTADILIKNGGHFMVYANAKEINEHITRVLI